MQYSYRIEQAIRAAAVLHKDQVRRGATPFPVVTHLYAVAAIVSDYTDDEDTIIAALLHDTVEDTDYSFEELQDDFGGSVREIVAGVTEPDVQQEVEKRNWEKGKKAYVKQLSKAPESSLMVSAADKIHNMRCIVEEYTDNHSQFVADFGGKLEDRVTMYQEISNILNRRLKNEIVSEFNHVFDEYKKFVSDVQKKQER